jgi:hypothetical protein
MTGSTNETAAEAEDSGPLVIDLSGDTAAVPDTEAKARDAGWLPEDEFQGNPEDWLTAEEFLAQADSLKAQLQQAQAEIAALKQQLADREGEFAQQAQRLHRASEVAIGRLREQTYAAGAQPQAPAATLHPDTRGWLAQNPWFEHDEAMRNVALGIYRDTEARFPDAPESDHLRMVDERLALAFPERFAPRTAAPVQTPAASIPVSPPAMPAVEGGTRRGVATFARGRTGDLPAEARQAAQRFVKLGLFRNLDDYANSYFETQNNG